MVDVDRLVTKHQYDLRDLKRGMHEAEGLVRSHAQRLDGMLANVGKGMGGSGFLSGALSVAGGNLLTKAFDTITGAMSGSVQMGFSYLRTQEQVALGFTKMLGGAQQAKKTMQELSVVAEKGPLELPQAYTGAQRLIAMHFAAKELVPTLLAVGDAVAATGKVGGEAAESINGITLALGQMRLKQRVSMEEANQLVERGVDAWKYWGDEIARTDKKFAKLSPEKRTAAVMRMAERNELDATVAAKVVVRGMMQEFGGTGERISKETLGGAESRLNDVVSRQLGTALMPVFESWKKAVLRAGDVAESGGANAVVGAVSQAAGGLMSPIDAMTEALGKGDVSSLGLGAIQQFVGGIKDNITQATAAGASIVTSAIEGGEREQAHVAARWGKLGQEAAGRYFSGLGFAKGPAQQEARPQDEPIEKALEDPRVRAMLDVIKRAEGGGVDTLYGGQKWEGGLDQFPPWSGKRFFNKKLGKWQTTHAAGSYQFQPGTYADVGREFGLPTDFSERTQDLHAVGLLKRLGAIDTLRNKGFEATIPLLGSQWASIPGSLTNPKDTTFNPKTLRKMYDQALGNPALMQTGVLPGVAQQEGEAAQASQKTLEVQSQLLEVMTERLNVANAYNKAIADRTAEAGPLGQPSPGKFDAYARSRGQWDINAPRPDSSTIFTGEDPATLAGAVRSQALESLAAGRDKRLEELDAKIADLRIQLSEARASDLSATVSGGGPFDWSGVKISDDQAKDVLEIFRQARGEVIETGGAIENLANGIIPRATQAFHQVGLAAEGAFDDLGPLRKVQSLGDMFEEMETRLPKFRDEANGILASLPEGIGDIFGSSVQQWDGTLKGFLNSLKMGVAQTLQEISAMLIKSAITKFLVSLGVSILGGAAGAGGGWGSASKLPGGSVGNYVFGGYGGALAEGGMIPATAGGKLIVVAEGGFPEVVLTTDPKHRARSSDLLGQYMKRTRIVPKMAAGGWSDALGDISSLSIGGSSYAPNYSQSTTSHKKVENKTYNISLPAAPGRQNYQQKRSQREMAEMLINYIRRYA